MALENKVETPIKELVARCQQGDRTAFQQLYRHHERKVRATLYQLCGTQNLDDLVQDVFLRAWRGLPKLREPAYFSTWLYRIAWNVATDRRRQLAKQPKTQSHVFNTDPNEATPSLAETLSRPQDSPDVMALHYQGLVKRGLAHLTQDHRAVVVLHDLQDMPQKDIAQVLKIPVGTVKSRLFHGRKALKAFLVQEGVTL